MEEHRKLLNHRLNATKSMINLTNSHIFFIFDNSKDWFLVGTGAACSIWPAQLLKEKPKPAYSMLQAVNQSAIQIFVLISLALNLQLI